MSILAHRLSEIELPVRGGSSLDFDKAPLVIMDQWKQNPYYYRVGTAQIPYLLAIDLNEIPSSALAMPPGVDVARFEFDDGFHIKHIYVSLFVRGLGWSIIVRHGRFFDHFWFNRDEQSIACHIINSRPTASTRLTEKDKESQERLALESMQIVVNLLMLRECKPKFFRPDILSADRHKYEEAQRKGDVAAIETIESRSRRRKGRGFVFDTGESWDIDVENPDTPMHRSESAFTQERTRCWIRRGHWRRVRHGKGMSLVKWHFFPPQLCRPDLPHRDVLQ